MTRITYLFVGMVLGGLLVVGALKYHVLKTNNGFEFVPKREVSFANTYVDIRNFTTSDWTDNAELVRAIVDSDRTDLLESSMRDNLDRTVSGWLNNIRN